MVIVAGGLFVLAVVIAMRPLKRIAISTQSLSVSRDAQATIVAALVYKGWFRFSFRLIAGTVTYFTASSVIAIAPLSVTTTATSPDALATVTGAARGTATITINGTSAEGSHRSETVSVTVV